jgi:hypothetical protein
MKILENPKCSRRKAIYTISFALLMTLADPAAFAVAIPTNVTVTSMEELKQAQVEQAAAITIEGELAQQVYHAKELVKLSQGALIGISAAVVVAVAAIPFTAGASVTGAAAGVAAGAAAVGGGLSTQAIIALAALGVAGVTAITAIYKDYEVIIFETSPPKLILRKTS